MGKRKRGVDYSTCCPAGKGTVISGMPSNARCVCPQTEEDDYQTVLVKRKGRARKPVGVRGPEDICRIARRKKYSPQEEITVYLLNQQNEIIGRRTVSRGTSSDAVFNPAMVFQAAMIMNANKVIVAHNHPSGRPRPSDADIRMTKRLEEVGKLLSIPLVDHVIVGDDKCVSLREEGVIR